jgi:hypothetical protein
MKNTNHKRSAYLSAEDMRLGNKPIKIWGYDKAHKFVCRLEVSRAGIEVFAGERGGKKLCDDSWQRFVKRLSPET